MDRESPGSHHDGPLGWVYGETVGDRPLVLTLLHLEKKTHSSTAILHVQTTSQVDLNIKLYTDHLLYVLKKLQVRPVAAGMVLDFTEALREEVRRCNVKPKPEKNVSLRNKSWEECFRKHKA